MEIKQATINDTFTLPCGAVLSNRLVKAAMTEGLADRRNHATQQHQTLYRKWSRSGAALLLTGNIQVDRRYMERPGNIAIDGKQPKSALIALTQLAAAGVESNNHFWAQISHAGRQTPVTISRESVGPSNVGSRLSDYFGPPRALGSAEILEIIERFVHAAKIVQDCGFTGLQIHAAHGYLINQFLSPDVNTRTDEWGGSLKNRARILLETTSRVRSVVGDSYPISVKLNVADFHKGGFVAEEAVQLAKWLSDRKVDLLELSGGTAEEPSMFLANRDHLNEERSTPIKSSTIAKEAYFLDYARQIRAVTSVP
ncbi:MAG: NADH:flavin oxidoreductase [Hahellaceae bacterium]|nr:NADH:flavin oxidoreductase [Hahellaceae bacterium]